MKPEEGGDTPEDPTVALAAEANKRAMQEDKQKHEAAMAAMDNHHEVRMEQMKQEGAANLKLAEMSHQEHMGAMQAANQSELADKNNEARVQQAKVKPKPANK
jgi:hypothetical protein